MEIKVTEQQIVELALKGHKLRKTNDHEGNEIPSIADALDIPQGARKLFNEQIQSNERIQNAIKQAAVPTVVIVSDEDETPQVPEAQPAQADNNAQEVNEQQEIQPEQIEW